MTTQILKEVIDKVLSSRRVMPAHFTTFNNRKQTFLVDFEQMDPDDEYEMASQAWNNLPGIFSERDSHICLKIGEDMMLASFIATKLGHVELVDDLKKQLTFINIGRLSFYLQPVIKKIVNNKKMIDYFNYCLRFGIERASIK